MELKRGVLTPPSIDPVLIGDVKFSSGHPSWIVTRFLETESPLTFNTDTHITVSRRYLRSKFSPSLIEGIFHRISLDLCE